MEKKTHIEFVKELQEISDTDLIGMANKALRRLCATRGNSFTMTVPPSIDDTDIVLSEVISRFEKRLTLTDK